MTKFVGKKSLIVYCSSMKNCGALFLFFLVNLFTSLQAFWTAGLGIEGF
jgi:hypothetical protein